MSPPTASANAPIHPPALGDLVRQRARLLVQVGLLAALLAACGLITPGFAHLEIRDGRLYGAMVDVVRNAAPTMILAVGMTLVIAMGAIDLSVGSTMAVAGTTAALVLTRTGMGLGPALAAGVLAGAGVGVVNGLVVALVGLQPIIATLLTLIAGRGLAQALTEDQKIPFHDATWQWMASGGVLGAPMALAPVAIAAGLGWVVLGKTVLGAEVQAMGSNARAARYCGVPIRRNTIAVFACSGACAALAGVLATGNIQEADVGSCGLYSELDAIIAVVLGGTALTGGRARLGGSLLGALTMQTLTVALQMLGTPTDQTLLIKGAVALAACAAQAPSLLAWVESRRRAGRPA